MPARSESSSRSGCTSGRRGSASGRGFRLHTPGGSLCRLHRDTVAGLTLAMQPGALVAKPLEPLAGFAAASAAASGDDAGGSVGLVLSHSRGLRHGASPTSVANRISGVIAQLVRREKLGAFGAAATFAGSLRGVSNCGSRVRSAKMVPAWNLGNRTKELVRARWCGYATISGT